ncbi:MAG: acyl-CoA desaturase [Acidobacteriota bacterium]
MFSWKALAVSLFLWWVAGSLGIGMSYHRLLTHRSYRVPKWVEYFLTICATLAMEGGPIFWVATHRRHHKHSDQAGDPHSPRDGHWWSHMGWILAPSAERNDPALMQRYAPDLYRDRFYRLLDRFFLVPTIILGFILYAIGGWQLVTWGVFMRLVFGLHSTWFVNSAAHIWGSRRFETTDDSRNNWWVALITFGEGWHNNHHAHPTAARHGLAWYELDMNWMGIRALQLMGLARSIKLVKLDELEADAHKTSQAA